RTIVPIINFPLDPYNCTDQGGPYRLDRKGPVSRRMKLQAKQTHVSLTVYRRACEALRRELTCAAASNV
ncbi:MAG: hypothetical protein WCA91_22445, partial [Candidatus Acidiferrales bacterium]